MTFNQTFRTAGLALVVALSIAACDNGEPAPPFEVAGTGSLSGLLFLDANRDGLFDPSAGDRALTNVGLTLRQRGTTTPIAGGSTRTDASGRFSLTGLPVGTNDLQIDTAGVGAGVAFCQNPIAVNVFVNENQFNQIAARAGCVITIQEAEQKPQNTPVTIAGIVTARPGQISTTQFWYIQDATGGTQLFGLALGGRTIAVGDSVEVTGVLTTFSGELEVTSPGQVNSQVVGVRQIAPQVLTSKQVNDASSLTDPLQGRLVTVNKARQTSAFAAGAGRNATFDDNSGPMTVRIESGVIANSADVATRFPLTTPAKCYNITGILRNFTTGPQLTPRSLTDVVEVACQ